MEGEVGNHLYQSATSADDLLLTPAPLQSPMSKFCLNFAFVSLVFKLLLILYIVVYHIFRQYIFSNVSSLQSSIFFLSTLILHMRLYWYLVCFFLPMIFFCLTADYDMSCGICVCIPGYEMRGAGSAAHWEYEVCMQPFCIFGRPRNRAAFDILAISFFLLFSLGLRCIWAS